MKKMVALCLLAFMLCFVSVNAFASTSVELFPGIQWVDANTSSTSNKYSSHWELWSQGASMYLNSENTGILRNMQKWGCRVVAQSKLLVEAGLASSDVAVFNPDVYFAWTVSNGYQNSSPYENIIGQGVLEWGKLNATEITMTSEAYTSVDQVMKHIREGKYVIMGCGDHHGYVGRAASLNYGSPIVLDSISNGSVWSGTSRLLQGYSEVAFNTVYIYTVGDPPGTLHVKGRIDGKDTGNLDYFGTMDIRVGSETSNDVNGYYALRPKGTTYAISDIKAQPGYEYLGVVSGSTSGTIASGVTTEVRLGFATKGNLLVQGLLDGVTDTTTQNYGTFDVYINGSLDAAGCTSYNKQWPKNTSYEIRNVQTLDHKQYDAETSLCLTGTITSNTTSTAVLCFTSDGTATEEWQVGKALPSGLDPSMLEIEYKHYYKAVAAASPGADWTCGSVARTYYQNTGSVEEYPYEKTVSNTYVQTGWYYYHWCGSNKQCNYERVAGKYEAHHVAQPSSSFTVTGTHTDSTNAKIKYYHLTWNTTQWNGLPATCENDQSAYWYRMYQYQNRVLVTEYNWSKESDWVQTMDTAATSCYVRWRLKEGALLDPDDIMEIIAPSSITFLAGETVHLDVQVVPAGIDTSVLSYGIADPEMFGIDENQNITCKYAGENTSTLLVISAPNGVTKTIVLIARLSMPSQWQEGEIPANLAPDMLDIEYQNHYEIMSATSPGEGWTRGNVHRTYYQNTGSVEEYPYAKTTSDSYVYTGGYYYHWCGSNNKCNYQKVAGKYETLHGPLELGLFDITETGTDSNNTAVQYYKLVWNSGQWTGGEATCATAQTAYWYRMYQYQPRVLVTEYVWSQPSSGWTAEKDPAATRYSVRWRLNPHSGQKSMELPSALTTIGAEAFAQNDVCYFILPAGVTSIGDNAFPDGACVFLHTDSLTDCGFEADGVWFVENGSYNEAFAQAHSNYLLREGALH